MELKLKNVGRIKDANIIIDGITVICGDNNTGKSTVGKVLYSIYSAFYHLQNNVRREKIDSMTRGLFSRYYVEGRILEKVDQIFGKLIDSETITDSDIQEAIDAIEQNSSRGLVQEQKSTILERIKKYHAIQEKEIAPMFLDRMISSEFGGKLANVNTSAKRADVTLSLKEGNIVFHTSGKGQKVKLEQYFSIEKRLIYIDDPFILDEAGSRPIILRPGRAGRAGHREALLNLVIRGAEKRSENVIDEILREKELQEIIKKIDQISNGTLRIENGELVYKHEGLKESLDLISISTGVKTFAILRSLLINGFIEENGIIVLDEPEVHLHPEWQIRLAEIIVLLQKVYGMNVVITTHSNDFLSAIDHYTKKYNTEEQCHYYLTEKIVNSNTSAFPMVRLSEKTNDMESMYASISEPFLKLYEQMEGV